MAVPHAASSATRQATTRLGEAAATALAGARAATRQGPRLPRRGSRLHLRRHRSGQPRRQGHRPGPARRRSAAGPGGDQRRRASRGGRIRPVPRTGPRLRRRRDPGGPLRAGDAKRPSPPCCGPATALVSIMYANNEVGTVQPVARLAALARAHGSPVPHRRRPGRRLAAAGHRRAGRGRAEHFRPQAGRAQGQRRAVCARPDPA